MPSPVTPPAPVLLALARATLHWGRSAASSVRGRLDVLLGRDPVVECSLTGHSAGGDALSVRYVGRRSLGGQLDVLFDRSAAEVDRSEEVTGRSVREPRRAASEPGSADLELCDPLVCSAPHGADGEVRFSPHLAAVLPLFRTFEEQLQRVPSEGTRRKLRQATRQGFLWRVCRSAQEFHRFYAELYRPFAEQRFGREAHLAGEEALAQLWRRRGTLILGEQGGRVTAGALLHRSPLTPDTLFWLKSGFALDGDARAVQARYTALEVGVIGHAAERGYSQLVHGIVRAIANDGVLVHKRRLGCSFQTIPSAPECRLRVGRTAALGRLPLLVSRAGRLEAWVACPEDADDGQLETFARTVRDLTFPTLAALRVFVCQGATRRRVREVVGAGMQRVGWLRPTSLDDADGFTLYRGVE